MVTAMKKAGIYLVKMGLEFPDPDERVNRGKREADPETAFGLCHEAGIIARAFLMLGQKGTSLEDLDGIVQAIDALPFRADQLRPNLRGSFPGNDGASSNQR